jgi:hypothetical protein
MGQDVIMGDATAPGRSEPASADETRHLPEVGLKEGLGMVEAIKTSLEELNLEGTLRHGVWAREIERY